MKTFAKQIGCDDYKTLDQVMLDGLTLSSLGSLEFLKDMPTLELLSMNFCQLKGLDVAFPAGLPLQRLELSDNELTSADLEKLANLQALTELHLNEAKLDSVKDLQPLKALKALKILQVLETPLAKTDNYRAEIFALLPNLDVVDSFDKEGNEVELSSDEDDGDSFGSDEESDEEENSDDSQDDDEVDSDEDEDDEEDDDVEEPASKKPKTN